jgi:hypothetical protein
MPCPAETTATALKELNSDLVNRNPVLLTSVSKEVSEAFGTRVFPGDFLFSVSEIGTGDFQVETDLPERLGVPEEQLHKVLERAILGVGGLNLTLSKMRDFDALSGLSDKEMPLFDEKICSIFGGVFPDASFDSFQRTVQLANVPSTKSVSPKDINFDRLLAIRETRECVEFRRWLMSSSSLSDQDIQDAMSDWSNKLGVAYRSKYGKTMRWLIPLITSSVPVVPQAYSFLDTFVFDRLVPQSGPIAFISELYPSIYKK